MALFEWRDDFSVKVASVDAQHKRLVGMLNELHDAMLKGASAEHLGGILNGLVEYTAYHFAHEEAMFAQTHYPDAEAHIAEHKALVDQVLAFKAKFEAKQASINMELMKFLKDWLVKHILGSDKKFGPHMVENHVN